MLAAAKDGGNAIASLQKQMAPTSAGCMSRTQITHGNVGDDGKYGGDDDDDDDDDSLSSTNVGTVGGFLKTNVGTDCRLKM